MALRIEFSARSRIDIVRITNRIAERSPRKAVQWSVGLRARLETLASFPNRCPVAPESAEWDNPVRELTYGKKPTNLYRIFFQVAGDGSRVVSIRSSLESFDNLDDATF